MAGPRRSAHKAPFPANLQPPPQPDRAALGRDAQKRHPQPKLRYGARIQDSNNGVPDPKRAKKLARLLRSGHRQLPRHQSRRFSGPELDGVYYTVFPNFHPWLSYNYVVQNFRPYDDRPDMCVGDFMYLHPFKGERPP